MAHAGRMLDRAGVQAPDIKGVADLGQELELFLRGGTIGSTDIDRQRIGGFVQRARQGPGGLVEGLFKPVIAAQQGRDTLRDFPDTLGRETLEDGHHLDQMMDAPPFHLRHVAIGGGGDQHQGDEGALRIGFAHGGPLSDARGNRGLSCPLGRFRSREARVHPAREMIETPIMPELPEVETVARGLAGPLTGRRLARVETRRPDLRFALPEDMALRLGGRQVARIGRRAKYILVHLEAEGAAPALVWAIHLGMSGTFVIDEAGGVGPTPGPHDHVIVETEDGVRLTFHDPRRFGYMLLLTPAEMAAHPAFAQLGPEPLDEDFTPAILSAALAGRLSPVKAALLDQRIVAGLGNIYVCEALFRAGISPKRLARTIPGKRAERLVPAIKATLREAIAAGGSSLRDYRRADGSLGYFQHSFAVYGREAEPCPGCTCTTGIRRIVQSGRSSFYCPTRQR